MRFLYIISLTLIVSTTLLAQKNVPGYMGKRWNIQYQLFTSPSFNNPNTSEVEVQDDANYVDVNTSLNFQSHIVAAYTFSKKMDLIGDFNFTKTYFDPFSDVYELNTSTLSFPGMTATGAALGIRIYRRHFAPLGAYLDFKLGYTRLNIEGMTYSSNDYSYEPNEDYSIDGGTKSGATITMGLGTNRVLKDRFIFSYGVDFTFFSGGMFNWKPIVASESGGESIFFPYGNTPENQEAYLKKAAARYAMHSMINLRVGIGILL